MRWPRAARPRTAHPEQSELSCATPCRPRAGDLEAPHAAFERGEGCGIRIARARAEAQTCVLTEQRAYRLTQVGSSSGHGIRKRERALMRCPLDSNPAQFAAQARISER